MYIDREKDRELNEIMNNIDRKIESFSAIKELSACAISMIQDGDKDTGRLKKILYNIGHAVFCKRFDFPKEDVRRNIDFKGSHDFNVAIVRCLEEAKPFYVKWLESMQPFIESDGLLWPRYVPAIYLGKSYCQFTVSDTVLLTRDDVADVNGLEECVFPAYYVLPDENIKYESLDNMERIFKKVIGDGWEESFERYKAKEWPICEEIQNHVEKYKNLSKFVYFQPMN